MEKIKIIFNQTLMISTAILFGLGLQGLIGYFAAHETAFTWPWYMPLSIILAGFLCSLPSLAIMSLETAGGKQMWIRIILHFLCVWAVLTFIGYLFHWYAALYQYGIIMIMYVIIYAFVWACTGWMYRKEDQKINEKIRNLQDEE